MKVNRSVERKRTREAGAPAAVRRTRGAYVRAVLTLIVAVALQWTAGCATTPATPPPAWVEKLPQEQSAIYAVGKADKSYYGEELDDATNDARAELARTIDSKVRSVVVDAISGGGGVTSEYIAEISSNLSEAALVGSQRVSWWVDCGGAKGRKGRTYVLLKLTPSMLVKGLQEQAKKAGKSREAAVTEKQIQQAFDELDKELAKRNK
jgi:hypothetical protein